MKKPLALFAALLLYGLGAAQTTSHRFPHIDVVTSSPADVVCAAANPLEEYAGGVYNCDPITLTWRLLSGVDPTALASAGAALPSAGGTQRDRLAATSAGITGGQTTGSAAGSTLPYGSINAILHPDACANSPAPSWCSGSTPTSWIKAAITQVGLNSGGTVDASGFAPGTIRQITSMITVSTNVTLLFDPASLWQPGSSTVSMFQVEPGSILEGLTVDCANLTTTGYTGNVIQTDPGRDYSIINSVTQRVTVIRNIASDQNCIQQVTSPTIMGNFISIAPGHSFAQISSMLIDNITANGFGDSIHLVSPANSYVNGLHFTNLQMIPNGNCIHMTMTASANQAPYSQFASNKFMPFLCQWNTVSPGTGILIDGSTTYTKAQENLFLGDDWDWGGGGYHTVNDSLSTSGENLFIGNYGPAGGTYLLQASDTLLNGFNATLQNPLMSGTVTLATGSILAAASNATGTIPFQLTPNSTTQGNGTAWLTCFNNSQSAYLCRINQNGASTWYGIGNQNSFTPAAGAALGSSPTISCAASSTCGWNGGTVNIKVGTSPAIGVLFTITDTTSGVFHGTYPNCTYNLFPANSSYVPNGSPLGYLYPTNQSTSVETVNTGTALTAGYYYVVTYTCVGI